MADVTASILEFEGRTPIRVSPEARQLLQLLVDGVVWDPHPAWNESRSARVGIADGLVAELPGHLREIVKIEHVTKTVTLYHVLHALTIKLDAWCPISK